MAVTLRFTAADLRRCRFAYSPMFETLAAIRLTAPEEGPGPHRRFLHRVAPALAAIDVDPVRALMPRRGYTADFLTPPPSGTRPSFDAELARVAATPPERVRAEIDRALGDNPVAGTRARKVLRDDPVRVLSLLCAAIAEVWATAVAPVWPTVRAVLEADIAHQSRRLADGGTERLFAELHPRLHWRHDTLIRDLGDDEHRDLDGTGLILLPSAFKWDQLVIIVDPPWQPTLIYPARGTGLLWEPAGRPHQHGRSDQGGGVALGRLIGRTRAGLLRGLDEPATTTWLAHRYALAAGTVSEHLTVLAGAGFITGERHGHQVRYRRTALGDAAVAANP